MNKNMRELWASLAVGGWNQNFTPLTNKRKKRKNRTTRPPLSSEENKTPTAENVSKRSAVWTRAPSPQATPEDGESREEEELVHMLFAYVNVNLVILVLLFWGFVLISLHTCLPSVSSDFPCF